MKLIFLQLYQFAHIVVFVHFQPQDLYFRFHLSFGFPMLLTNSPCISVFPIKFNILRVINNFYTIIQSFQCVILLSNSSLQDRTVPTHYFGAIDHNMILFFNIFCKFNHHPHFILNPLRLFHNFRIVHSMFLINVDPVWNFIAIWSLCANNFYLFIFLLFIFDDFSFKISHFVDQIFDHIIEIPKLHLLHLARNCIIITC